MTQNGGGAALFESEPSHWHDLLEPEAAAAAYQRVAPTGELIGPYKVLRSLGQGGMGEVFLAERADKQFEQRVAIKLVRRELLSKQVQSRLRVERQILASLEHPNIARLLDGGTTRDGIPYIVMEYVDGEPIDTYCDRHRLTINERLELFRSVCDAVHSAHQNLIVHRDLKPSNILVTANRGPKLLDFGIAKMLDARQFTQTVALTEADYRMLTPDHASPEQLTGDLITTASDTYVLGVLLYELLTGCKPFAVKGRSFAELERVICEEPPLPPSHIFASNSSESAQDPEEIAASRSTTVAKLKRELQGDLSSIILMALRKEPERRYSSVRQFAEDIGRYLQGLPVNARQDTWAYRTAKFVRRHAVVVGLVGILAATLVGFTVFTYLNSIEVQRQSEMANAALQVLNDLFNAPNPEQARGREPTILDFIERAPEKVRTELAGQKAAQARLFNTIGEMYLRLGKHDQAQDLLEESWSIFHQELQMKTPVVADVALNLGELFMRNDHRRSEEFYQRSIEISRDSEGRNSRGVARGQCGLGYLELRRNALVAAEQHLRQCLALYAALPNVDTSESAIALDNLGRILASSGKLAEAESTYRAWLKSNQSLPTDSPRVVEQQQSLATVLQRAGKLQEAADLYRRVLVVTRKVWPDSERLMDVLLNLGWALQELERFEEADARFAEAQSTLAKFQNVTDEDRVYLMGRRAGLALDRSATAEAKLLYDQGLSILSKLESPRYKAWMLSGLSKTLLQMNQPKDAQHYIEQALSLLADPPARDTYPYALARAIQGRALWQQGMRTQAAPLLQEGYDKYVAQRGRNVPESRLLRSWLAEAEVAAANAPRTH